MEKFRIRQATIDDAHACAEVEASCFPPSEGASERRIRKRILAFPQGFLTLERSGKVIGFINCAATNKPDLADESLKDMIGHESDGKNLVVFSLTVKPEFQGRGYSTLLMKEFIRRARLMNKENILLMCKDPMVEYYKKFGFHYIALSNSTHGGVPWHEMSLCL